MAISDMTPAPKRRRRKAATEALPAFEEQLPPEPSIVGNDEYEVLISSSDAGVVPQVDPDNPAAVIISHEDGDVTVDFSPQSEEKERSTKHDDNLAKHMDESELDNIASQLIELIGEDERSRQQWLQQRADGLDQLGLKVDKPGTGSIGTPSTAVPGQSSVRDPIMLEAVVRGQANAYAELCPAAGPCKVVNYGEGTGDADALATELEKDLNFYLTTTASEYYPDTREMLAMTVYASGMFKKVYWCPRRRRPVSESVDGADLIMPSNVKDLKNAGRITHQINMRHSVMRMMQLRGEYRDVELTPPTPDPNALVTKEAEIAGLQAKPQREEDQTYTVYECYCELDLPGYEHKENGKPTGLPLPYRVTMDKDSGKVLELRRNWDEDDEDFVANIPFVAFPYVTGFGGIYGIGLLQMLGNITLALTALLREGIDAGMFANFPGFLLAKTMTRQLNNELRVAPGSGVPIDLGPYTDIRQVAMPLPYKDVTPGMFSLMQMLREVGTRLGGTAEIPVGEGKQDSPVGTTIAMIEQATKIEGGVHKALHSAQSEELRLLVKLLKDDPESLWRGNRRPALGATLEMRMAKFERALADCEIVPASDPNVPSSIHRHAKASALLQMAGAYPQAFNVPAVLTRALTMMGIGDPQAVLMPPAPPQQGPDPMMMAEMAKLALAKEKLDIERQKLVIGAQEKAADRASRETVEALKIANTLGVHPNANQVVDDQLVQLAPLIKPAQAGSAGPPDGGMSEGGAVEAEPDPEREKVMRDIRFAMEIADYFGTKGGRRLDGGDGPYGVPPYPHGLQ